MTGKAQLVTADQGTHVTLSLAVQSQAWQPLDPIQASPSPDPSPKALQDRGRSLSSVQGFISMRGLKRRESGVWWPQQPVRLEQLRGGGKCLGFSPKKWCSCFSFGLLHYAKFSPPRSCSRIPFSAKSRQQVLLYPRKNETKPGVTWTNAETCWSCLWRQEGFGESWQLFLTISPSKKQMKGNCQSWTGWVLLIQHFQRGQEVSRACYWNVRQPQLSTQVGRQILLWCKLLIKSIPWCQWQFLRHF